MIDARKPDTRIKAFLPELARLAQFHKLHRPQCHCIHLRDTDWRLLREHPEVARLHGFTVEPTRIAFQGFELQPIETGEK